VEEFRLTPQREGDSLSYQNIYVICDKEAFVHDVKSDFFLHLDILNNIEWED
jgi:hypothetical protein